MSAETEARSATATTDALPSETTGVAEGASGPVDEPAGAAPPAIPVAREPFEQASMAHLDALYRTALRMTRNPQDAEDLVQDALVRAYRFYDRFEPGTNFRAWLFKILTNTYINSYRRKQVRPQESSLDNTEDFFLFNQLNNATADGVPGASTSADEVESTVLDQLGADSVQRAIDQLPPQFRSTVQLSDVEGLSYAEVADALGVAKGTVMSRLFRGRRLLQRALWDQAQIAGYAEGSKVLTARNGDAAAGANGNGKRGTTRGRGTGGKASAAGAATATGGA